VTLRTATASPRSATKTRQGHPKWRCVPGATLNGIGLASRNRGTAATAAIDASRPDGAASRHEAKVAAPCPSMPRRVSFAVAARV